VAIQQSLLQVTDDLHDWMKEFARYDEVQSSCYWRPNSWGRWVSLSPSDALACQLTERLKACP
jgi:hypothetical protein